MALAFEERMIIKLTSTGGAAHASPTPLQARAHKQTLSADPTGDAPYWAEGPLDRPSLYLRHMDLFLHKRASDAAPLHEQVGMKSTLLDTVRSSEQNSALQLV